MCMCVCVCVCVCPGESGSDDHEQEAEMVGACGKNEGLPSAQVLTSLQTSQWKEVSWWTEEKVE